MLFGKFDRSSSVGNISGRNVNGMGQSVCVYGNMPLNARYFLPSVVALFMSGIRVLDALRVNDAKARVRRTTKAGADLAN